MINITAIGIDSLLVYINKAFEGDTSLCNRYHINPGSFNDCAADTYNRIIEIVKSFQTVDIYGIKVGEGENCVKIGFIVLIPNAYLLYSFGINKSFRTNEIKGEFLKFVNAALNDKTVVYLYQRNERAIRFFERNRFKVQGTLLDKEELLIELELCQHQPQP